MMTFFITLPPPPLREREKERGVWGVGGRAINKEGHKGKEEGKLGRRRLTRDLLFSLSLSSRWREKKGKVEEEEKDAASLLEAEDHLSQEAREEGEEDVLCYL